MLKTKSLQNLSDYENNLLFNEVQIRSNTYKAKFAEGTFFADIFPSLRTFVNKKVGI